MIPHADHLRAAGVSPREWACWCACVAIVCGGGVPKAAAVAAYLGRGTSERSARRGMAALRRAGVEPITLAFSRPNVADRGP